MSEPAAPRLTRARWWLLAATVVLLALAASLIGLRNGYAYDDVEIVQNNAAVHTLHGWWHLFAQSYWPAKWSSDGYRPLAMVAFALQWAVAGGAPWVFHLTNILLYAGVALAVFWLASELLPPLGAWLAAALFAVHPVHVEAVANVVGQSELWVALLVVLSMALYLRARAGSQAGSPPLPRGAMLTIGLLFTAALFFKEHAIVLPALLVAAEATVVRDPRPLTRRFAALRPFGLMLTLLAVAFLWARTAIKGGDFSGFVPYVVFQSLNLSYADRVLTMIGVVPTWLRLMLWPAHLSIEYSPPYVDVAQGPDIGQLPGLLLLGAVLGLCIALWRRRDEGSVACFGIAAFAIAMLPASNLILPAGFIIAERTLFLPTVGAMLAVGAGLYAVGRRLRTLPVPRQRAARAAAALALAAVLAAGAWRSHLRTEIWKGNEQALRQAVADAPDSYRAHYMLSTWYLHTRRGRLATREFQRAMQLFPADIYMAFSFAREYQLQGMCKPASVLFEWVFSRNPTLEAGPGHGYYAECLIAIGKPEEAREAVLQAMSLGGVPLRDLRQILATADSMLVASGKRPSPPPPPRLARTRVAAGKTPRMLQNTSLPAPQPSSDEPSK